MARGRKSLFGTRGPTLAPTPPPAPRRVNPFDPEDSATPEPHTAHPEFDPYDDDDEPTVVAELPTREKIIEEARARASEAAADASGELYSFEDEDTDIDETVPPRHAAPPPAGTGRRFLWAVAVIAVGGILLLGALAL